jgi:hypothetical protein
MLGSWWNWYWNLTGGNVLAMPLCGLLAVAFAVCCQKPIGRWWRKHFGAEQDLAEIREAAESAHRIAADLYRHHTGHAHPYAPGPDPKKRG